MIVVIKDMEGVQILPGLQAGRIDMIAVVDDNAAKRIVSMLCQKLGWSFKRTPEK